MPIYEQVVHAVKTAIARGQLKPGDSLPSVRELSRELSINPNTAQKVISTLVQERIVEVRPGIGSIIAPRAERAPERVAAIIDDALPALIVEAITTGIDENSFLKAVRRHWRKISAKEEHDERD